MLTINLPARGQYRVERSRGVFVTEYAVGPVAEAFLAKCEAQGFICVPARPSRHRDHFRAAYFRHCDRRRLPYVETMILPNGGGRVHYDLPPPLAVIDPAPLREELSAYYVRHPEPTREPRRGFYPEQFRPASVSAAIAYIPLSVGDNEPLRIVLRHLGLPGAVAASAPTGNGEAR